MRLDEAVRRLAEAGGESARQDAAEIFCELGGISKAQLLAGFCECNVPAAIEAVERRAAREPLQYILGYTYFYRERYSVDKSCLIPRPDTEILVDTAVKAIPEGERFLDLCTGSGCVGISVLNNTKSTTALLVDISESALAIARKNAEDNGVLSRAEFEICDVMAAIPEGEYFAILSNPPYVSNKAYATLEPEIAHEPDIAFLGGEDGADFYRRLIPACKARLKPGGFLAFEIGYDQGELLTELGKAEGFFVEIVKDLSGNDRVAVLKPKA